MLRKAWWCSLLNLTLAAILLAQTPAPFALPAKRLPQLRNSPGAEPGQSAQSPQAAQGPPGSIKGTVTSRGGELLRKAEVRCLMVGGGPGNRQRQGPAAMNTSGAPGGGTTDMTDASGSFECSGLTPGNYQVAVIRTGYVLDTVPGRNPTIVPVEAGKAATLNVKMLPQAVITGKVFDEDRDPMQFIQVQLLREMWVRGKRTLAPSANAITNDLGEYRMSGVARGRYYLFAQSNRRLPSQAADQLTYVGTFYPGARDAEQARLLELEPGQQVGGMDLQLVKSATFSVKGKVVDPSGQPLRNLNIVMNEEGTAVMVGGQRHPVRQDQNGNFTITQASPGRYHLMALLAGQNTRMAAFESIQVNNRDLEDVVLTLRLPVDLRGVLQVESGAATIPTNATVTLDAGGRNPMGPSAARVSADGSFSASVFAGLAYRVSVSGVPAGMYVKAIRSGQVDALETPVDVQPGASLAITLSPKAAALSGTIVDAEGKPLPSVLAVLAPPASRRSNFHLFATAVSSDGGTFSFPSIAPGDYKVFLFPPGVDTWQNPAYLAQQEGRGTSVTLAESETRNLQLTFQP